MTRSIRVHFDGKVLVPDEAVDLPVGCPLQVEVHDSVDTKPQGSPAELARWIESLPPLPEKLPSDLAAEHDHYLYGTPKRS